MAAEVKLQLGSADIPHEERPFIVSITTPRGTWERSRVKSSGFPGEVTPKVVAEKFRLNAGLVLPDEKMQALEERVLQLENVKDVRELTPLLSP